MTEKELASAVQVPQRTVVQILAGKDPIDLAVWEQFAKYFRMDVDFLRTGEWRPAHTMVQLPARPSPSAAGHIRRIPLLNWQQLGQMARSKTLPGILQAEAMIETTDVAGVRTCAVMVQDDSMEPLFGEGEMIFVNPDLEWQAGDYVITNDPVEPHNIALLRQVKRIGSQWMLHPLNRKYDDLPLTTREEAWGKVVRLRKNL
jgi:SOS-response transcriptional repressor LexA